MQTRSTDAPSDRSVGRHAEVRAPGGVDGVPWFGVSGVSGEILAIGVNAGARNHHPRLLIVLGYQTAGRSKRQALADTGTGDDCVCSSAPMEVHLPISGALCRARSPIGGGRPSPIQRLGLHDPARFLSDGTFGTVTRWCRRPTVRCCSPDQLVHRNAQWGWGLHAYIPGTGGAPQVESTVPVPIGGTGQTAQPARLVIPRSLPGRPRRRARDVAFSWRQRDFSATGCGGTSQAGGRFAAVNSAAPC